MTKGENMSCLRFTILDCLAHRKLFEDGRNANQRVCCWLVMSEDAKKQAREGILKFWNEPLIQKGILITPMTEETFDKVMSALVPAGALAAYLENWKAVELERERERESEVPNPLAWFV